MNVLTIFTPLTHAKAVRTAIAEAGGGRYNNYDHCSFSSIGTGRFRPLDGANPSIGSVGSIEDVEEERLEVLVSDKHLDAVLTAARAVHPYEEPAIYIVKLEQL